MRNFSRPMLKPRLPFLTSPFAGRVLQKYSRMHKDVKYGRMNQLVLLRSESEASRGKGLTIFSRGGILRGLAPRGFMGHFVYARTGQGCPVVAPSARVRVRGRLLLSPGASPVLEVPPRNHREDLMTPFVCGT